MAEQPYVFSGRGNYGGPEITAEELVEGYTSGPPCHNLGHYRARPIGKVVIGPDASTVTVIAPPEPGEQQVA